jgi:hypothetical protein
MPQPRADFLQVPDEVYQRVFQEDADGQMILDELCRLFYDVPCFEPGRTSEETIHIDGKRSVIMYILKRAGVSITGG